MTASSSFRKDSLPLLFPSFFFSFLSFFLFFFFENRPGTLCNARNVPCTRYTCIARRRIRMSSIIPSLNVARLADLLHGAEDCSPTFFYSSYDDLLRFKSTVPPLLINFNGHVSKISRPARTGSDHCSNFSSRK